MVDEGKSKGKGPMLTKCFGWWVNLPNQAADASAAAPARKMAMLRHERSNLPNLTLLAGVDEQQLKDMISQLNTQPLEEQRKTIAAYDSKELELLEVFKVKQKHDRLDKDEQVKLFSSFPKILHVHIKKILSILAFWLAADNATCY